MVVEHEEAAENLDRILTVPNVISLARVALLIAFFFELFAAHERVFAASLMAVAGVTDFLDGYVARRFHLVSNLGKALDPTVDRMVLLGAFLAVVVYGAIPIWLAVAVVTRETLVSLAVLVVAMRGGRRVEVLFIGKAGTFGYLCAMPFLLAGDGPGSLALASRITGWVIIIPSLAFAFAAACAYVPAARHALKDAALARAGVVEVASACTTEENGALTP